jgi:hypothetical protein
MVGKQVRSWSVIVAITAAIVLFGLSQQTSLAKLVACRSDPVVVLSDGTIIDVSADIETMLWNVTEVHYTLQIPEGKKPILVIHTPTWLTSTETFTITAVNEPHQYTSTTTVRARGKTVGVKAHMLVNLGYGTAKGVTGQSLGIELYDNGLLNGLLGN